MGSYLGLIQRYKDTNIWTNEVQKDTIIAILDLIRTSVVIYEWKQPGCKEALSGS